MKEKEIKYMGTPLSTKRWKSLTEQTITADHLPLRWQSRVMPSKLLMRNLAHDIGHVASLWICRLTHISRMRSMLT